MKRAPSSASAAEDMTDFIICAMVMTAPLFVVMAELLDIKKCPPDMLHAFVSEIYEASLWPARTILLALYVMIASGRGWHILETVGLFSLRFRWDCLVGLRWIKEL